MAKHIYLVENDELAAAILRKKLWNEGYDIKVFKSSLEGLESIKKKKPDLLLIDMVLRETSGFDIVSKLKREKATKNLPVIMISNAGKPVELEKAKEVGASDVIVKAEFDLQDIINKIKKQLEK